MQATQTRTDQPCTILDTALSRKRSRARQGKKKHRKIKNGIKFDLFSAFASIFWA